MISLIAMVFGLAVVAVLLAPFILLAHHLECTLTPEMEQEKLSEPPKV